MKNFINIAPKSMKTVLKLNKSDLKCRKVGKYAINIKKSAGFII